MEPIEWILVIALIWGGGEHVRAEHHKDNAEEYREQAEQLAVVADENAETAKRAAEASKKMLSLLKLLATISISALPLLKNIDWSKVITAILTKALPLILKNWKAALLTLILVSAGFLAGWWMKSPEIKTVVKTDVLTITELVPVTRTVEVARPHNCQAIKKPSADEIQMADGLVSWLMRKSAAYDACLDSLD